MRSLKHIRTATAKRAERKRKIISVRFSKKTVGKTKRALISQDKAVAKKSKIEDAHKKQKEQVDRAFVAGREIIADASEKAKKLLNDAVKDQASARELEIDLEKQLAEAVIFQKEVKELQTRVEDVAQGQEENEKKLNIRQEGIFTTEQAITRLSDETVSFRQSSIDLLQDIVALIDLTAERIGELHKQDETRQQVSKNVASALGGIANRLKDKEEHLTKKDSELNEKSVMLEDRRTSLNMAGREIRNLSK